MNTTIDLARVGYQALLQLNQEYVITDEQFQAALTAMAVEDAEEYRKEIKPSHLQNAGSDCWGDDDCNVGDLAFELRGEITGTDWDTYLMAFENHCKQMILATA